MKLKNIVWLAAVVWLVAQTSVSAQSTNTPSPALVQLHQLVQDVQAKASAGQASAADYADEFKRYDALIAAEKGTNSAEAAAVVYMKARLYLEVIKDYDNAATMMGLVATNYQGTEFSKGAMQVLEKIATDLVGTPPGRTAAGVLKSIQTQYPDSMYGQYASEIVGKIGQLEAAKKINDTLMPGTEFPDFTAVDLDDKPLSVHALKGKVVLLDFWATWCPVCVAELPGVIATYQKYHNDGFEIIGINLDTDRAKLDTFLRQHDGMSWPQDFNAADLAAKYGADLLPFTLLIGPTGKIIARDPRGPELEMAVAEGVALK